VVNIAVQTVLKEIEENPYHPVIAVLNDPSSPSEALCSYVEALHSNPVHKVQEIVAVCRRSGSCHAHLKALLKESNKKGIHEIYEVQLLQDCVTCWP
jgi:hypothetical protein